MAALGLILTPLAGTASAASGEDLAGEQAVVLKVDAAQDKAAAIKALSVHERDLLQQSVKHMTHNTGTKVVRTGQATRVGGAAGAASPNVVHPDSGGCWSQYWYDDWYDFTVKTGSTWMEADWCSNGSSITSYYTTNVGAQGAGTNSYEGLSNSGSRNVGWEVRQYQSFHFNFWGVDAYPCMQIRGGATGLYSEQESCNVG
ncbi:hypothetical protein C7C46_01935 [Streptomyces tateyamensis]|uniref:Uncharacterized protein n=1 Tax=Streptomyces tateyamensis TaxID=565073 RepID=A0A2V4PSM1_9ACTN|nr:hypothetical protein [Streptomyces tateyamensis]PYC88052.1 hypothetical protein C7C46_01935 [Streptomyces tateyamensis]